jgi:hypothetical protein
MAGWTGCGATQNNAAIPCSLTMHNSNLYALVKAVPDRGEVRLSKGATTGLTMKKATDFKGPETWIKATIFDLHGRRMGTVHINAQGFVSTKVTNNFKPGIYLFKTDGATKFEKKLIVQ